MADRYLLEASAVDGYLLEDASGVLLLDAPIPFDASYFPSIIQLTHSFRNVRDRSLYLDGEKHPIQGGGGLASEAASFDPATESWTIPSARYQTVRKWSVISPDLDWLANQSSVPYWPMATDRMGARTRRWQDTNTTISWQVIDPSLFSWVIDSHRRKSATYWTAPWTSTDWIIATQTPAVFDAALFAGIAQLVGIRTPAIARLLVQWHWSRYDISWVHDVIPLTDPVVSTIIHIRPIAPIMSARRRNKRRR